MDAAASFKKAVKRSPLVRLWRAACAKMLPGGREATSAPWRIEPLEPRVLLSAEAPVAALARVAEPAVVLNLNLNEAPVFTSAPATTFVIENGPMTRGGDAVLEVPGAPGTLVETFFRWTTRHALFNNEL